MRVVADVDEADIGPLSVGQPVSFSVDAFLDESFEGHVSQVRFNPVNVQNVVTYEVLVDVDNRDLKLRPGMTAEVSFEVARGSDYLRVPNAALRFQPERLNKQPSGALEQSESPAEKHVYVLEADGMLRRVAVESNLYDDRWAAIDEGALREGESVVVTTATPEVESSRGGIMSFFGRRRPQS